MADRIAHIGYPKTGSTFLQREVFPKLVNYKYLGFHESMRLLRKPIYADPLDYDSEEIKTEIEEYFGVDAGLISLENLVGSPFYYKGLNRSNVPLILKKLGFNKILVVVRDQVEAIDSYYRQFIANGGMLSFRDFIDLADSRIYTDKYFAPSFLKYAELINVYSEVFGKENVLVLNYGDLKVSDDFMKPLLKFLDHSEIGIAANQVHNTSLSNFSIFWLRFLNHFTYSSVSPNHLISKKISSGVIWRIFVKIIDPLMGWVSPRKSYVKKHGLEGYFRDFYKESNDLIKKEHNIRFY